jgi:hypothetical protein
VSERDKSVEDAAARAVLAMGKEAARRAVDGALSEGEEPVADEAERARASKRRRWKLIAIGVLALFLVVGVVGMLISYWQYFLLAGLVGIAGLFGWWRVRRRLAERKKNRIEVAAPIVEQAPKVQVRAAETQDSERDARALAEAEAVREQSIEDELAELKARVKR